MTQKNDKHLFRNIAILLGSTLSVMSGAAITPALPKMSAYFSSIENAEFLVKMMLAIPPLFIAIFSPIAGMLFDKFGRTKILSFSILLFVISGSAGFYLDDLVLILASRAVMGIAVAGTMTGFIAIIGDFFKGDGLNRFMGIQASVMSFSGVVYLLAGGKLADISWNYAFIIFLIPILLLPFLLIYTKDNVQSRESLKINSTVAFNQKAIMVYALAFVGMAVYLMVPTQLPFLINQIETVSSSKVGIFISAWIFSSAVASFFFKKLKSNMGFSRVFSLSLIIWALGYFVIFFSNNLSLIMAGLCIAGIGNGLFFPNLKVLLLTLSDENSRGIMSGLLTTGLYLGQFFSPIIMEPIIRAFDIFFIFMSVGIFLILFSVYFWIRK